MHYFLHTRCWIKLTEHLPDRPQQYISIQYLRGIAALAVVLYHAEGPLRRMGYVDWWPPGTFTGAGVDLFFVISGFIMWVTTAGASVTPLEFARRRVARIVPLYWLFTTILVLISLVLPQVLQTVRFDAILAFKSYFFIPALDQSGQLFPILIPGWTLNYEMEFYVLFAACLFIKPPMLRLLAISAALIAISAVGFAFRFDSPALLFWSNSIIIEFLLGILVGWGWTRVPVQPAAWPVLVGVAAVAMLIPDAPRFITVGVPAAMIALAGLLIERSGRLPHLAIAKRIGDASYSLYLSHVMVLSALGQGWRRVPVVSTTLPGHLLFMMVAVVASVTVGLLVYVYVERPLGKLAARAFRPSPVAVAGSLP